MAEGLYILDTNSRGFVCFVVKLAFFFFLVSSAQSTKIPQENKFCFKNKLLISLMIKEKSPMRQR